VPPHNNRRTSSRRTSVGIVVGDPQNLRLQNINNSRSAEDISRVKKLFTLKLYDFEIFQLLSQFLWTLECILVLLGGLISQLEGNT
jgi:hypothetical protein